MISIFICEDDYKQRKELEKIISNYIIIEDMEAKIALSTGDPQEILDYLKIRPGIIGMYFFDVNLNNQMNGISLAAEIRKNYDVEGKIVFVTAHGEHAYLTFMYKVEALDYIVKDRDDVSKKVLECIKIANDQLQNQGGRKRNIFCTKIGDKIRMIPCEEIMFFESSDKAHNVILHLENGQLEFRSSINKILEEYDMFFRSHRSYVVNMDNIHHINRERGEIEMYSGEKALISQRRLKPLEEELAKRNRKKG